MRVRKKPVEVNAWRINDLLISAELNWEQLPLQVIDAYERGEIVFGANMLRVHTLEGVMDGGREAFLIEGVAGEFYPCAPNVFAETYDVLEK